MDEDRFRPSWLELREPADHRARPLEILPLLEEAWRSRGWRRVVDLGSGTGSNLRYLAPRLPGPQRWTLVDHDGDHLEEAEARTRPLAAAGETTHGAVTELECRQVDLDDEGLEAVEGAHLVTASALLDLVSRAWLERLVARTTAAGGGALLALSYDGEIRWSGPPHPDDHLVREAVNEHQRGEKGLGRALGPSAGATAERLFREAGYRTWLRPSPWILTGRDRALGQALVAGWAEAARELRPEEADRLDAWARHRRRGLDSGTLTVGHLDLLALP